MRLTIEEGQHISLLILGKENNPCINALKNMLASYSIEVITSSRTPHRLDQFQYVFLLDDREILLPKKIPLVLFLFQNKKRFERITHRNNTYDKIINIDINETDQHILQNVLWFIFSTSSEKGLNVERSLKKHIPKKKLFPIFKRRITKKILIVASLTIFFVVEFFFIIPTLIGGIFLYKSGQALKNYDVNSAQNYLYASQPFISLGNTSYQISRPVLSFFFLALLPDDINGLENTGYSFIQTSLQTSQNGKTILSLLLQKNKTVSEKKETIQRISYLKNQLESLSQEMNTLEGKLDLPFKQAQQAKDSLIKNNKTLDQLNQLLTKSDSVLGKDTEKNYLVLFENNMELRPGGGFIGSYGIITLKDYTITQIGVHDVYDADGQLKGHIDPPDAIRTYLNQPHWFLRDSNFSPDFPENYNKAIYFLDQEVSHPPFDGGMAITTTAINNILQATGDIYLPDYNETINKDNFYIKTETHVETGFFPGSIQKKTFLSSLVNQILIKLETTSPKDLFLAVKKSLDEKQMVVYLADNDIQKNIDQSGWSGKLLVPQCAITIPQCIIDGFFSVDANLGVNKANFFINRLLSMKVAINNDGVIKNTATLLYSNDSSYEVFPGGTYKNYLQIFLPLGATVSQITKDGTLVDNYTTQTNDFFTIISFYTEVLPKSSQTITITYQLKNHVQKGLGAYELVVQKQIGAPNSDLQFEISFPDNLSIVNHNFDALAKDQKLIYNTSLSSDKIFLIEFMKL